MANNQGERIAAVRKLSGLSQDAFAKAIGLRGNSGVSQFEKGTSKPSDQTLMVIADKFNINYEWLLSGNGEMLRPAFPERTAPIADTAALSAAQWMKRWEDEVRARKEDRALFERMYSTMEKDLEVFRSLVKVRQ